jgi:primosomal protein N' (replication factor Y)
MIAKGLDFANVTLVGVLNGDASLNIPDYRSAERTYSLLNQVAGRAGRGIIPGEVIIQGFNIDHYSIVLASKHDYDTFYNEELNIRKKLNYPPYCNLALIRIMGKNYDGVVKESNKISDYLNSKLNKKVTVLGPSAASMPKINDIYYFQIILKYKDTKEIKENIKFILNQYQLNKYINVDVDFCPYKI